MVGTLTGGGSFCDTPTQPDYFGKMSYHFGSGNPNIAAEELKNWLAPVFNVTVLNGSDDPCATIGIAERALPAPTVAPNPSLDRFTVNLPESISSADRWEARDVTGRFIDGGRIGADRFVIDASAWGEGAYALSIFSEGEVVGASRLVKQ